MTSRLRGFRPDSLRPDQRALYDAITTGPRSQGAQHFALTEADGSLRGPFNALLLSPAVGHALQEVGAAVRYHTSLSDRARELAILLVAAHWQSRFEREAHEPIARAAGLTGSEILATREKDAAAFTGAERTVAVATMALLHGDLDDELWAAASTELGETVIFELTALVGYYATLALQLRVFRV